MRRTIGPVVFAVCVALVAALGLWMHFSAPCGMYKFSKAKDVPARCLSTFNK